MSETQEPQVITEISAKLNALAESITPKTSKTIRDKTWQSAIHIAERSRRELRNNFHKSMAKQLPDHLPDDVKAVWNGFRLLKEKANQTLPKLFDENRQNYGNFYYHLQNLNIYTFLTSRSWPTGNYDHAEFDKRWHEAIKAVPTYQDEYDNLTKNLKLVDEKMAFIQKVLYNNMKKDQVTPTVENLVAQIKGIMEAPLQLAG